MVTVRFNRHFDIYTGGEMAGFTPQRAQELVLLGVAELVTPAATPVEVPTPGVVVALPADNAPKGKAKK